jgi:flagellar biosynthesis GTPase FlhF
VSKLSTSSITDQCKQAREYRFGRKIVIVDTPGLFDTDKSPECIKNEIGKAVAVTSPGPHLFLIVIQLGRFTEEDSNTVQKLEELFGKAMYDFAIVAFTRIDDLDEGQSLESLLQESPHTLRELLRKCGNRYVGFKKTKPTESNPAVKKLLDMVGKMRHGRSSYYTSELFKKAEREMKRKDDEEKERIRREKEEEKEKLEKALKEKYAKKDEESRKKREQEEADYKKRMKELDEQEKNIRDKNRQDICENKGGSILDTIVDGIGSAVKFVGKLFGY